MQCRKCGVCCIEASISSAIPGMPEGKKAGVRCSHLKDDNLCDLFGSAQRPKVCASFQPSLDFCGQSAEEAISLIRFYEKETSP